MKPSPDLIRGTLDTILLETAAAQPMYGYQICKTVNRKTNGFFELREGSLYPALHKLERQGLLRSRWVEADEGRRRKYYEITPKGQKARVAKRAEWQQFSAAMEALLEPRYAY